LAAAGEVKVVITTVMIFNVIRVCIIRLAPLMSFFICFNCSSIVTINTHPKALASIYPNPSNPQGLNINNPV
jgi:hypothetical protein